MNKKLTHIDQEGNARMVDVSDKPEQVRIATAHGIITLQQETRKLIEADEIRKGDVLKIAEFAGIQAAKKTSDLIPLCHPLPLTNVSVIASLTNTGVEVTATAKYTGKTGVEMEALTAVQVALLTIYDMCKAVDKNMTIGEVKLTSKTKK